LIKKARFSCAEGETVIADKRYVSKDFAEEMEKRGVRFVAINMIKSDEEYYRFLSREENRNTILNCR